MLYNKFECQFSVILDGLMLILSSVDNMTVIDALQCNACRFVVTYRIYNVFEYISQWDTMRMPKECQLRAGKVNVLGQWQSFFFFFSFCLNLSHKPIINSQQPPVRLGCLVLCNCFPRDTDKWLGCLAAGWPADLHVCKVCACMCEKSTGEKENPRVEGVLFFFVSYHKGAKTLYELPDWLQYSLYVEILI